MSKIPQRFSLPKQAASIISKMIEDGELVDFLPGERELATRLQIGRDTLRVALELLEDQEFITHSEHGKRRKIIRKSRAKSKKTTKRIAFLSPKDLGELPPWTLIEVDTLRGLLSQHNYEFDLVSPGLFHLKRPDTRLKKLIENSHYDLWILHQCPEPVQKWFQKAGIPALVRGYSYDNIDLPSIDVDWQATSFHAGGELARAGHKSVGLLIPNTQLAGLIATEEGIRQAIESNYGGTVHKIVDKINNDSVHRALELAFNLENPPTAIVATRTRHILTAITWLAQHRIRIPQDLSILCLAYDTWFDHMTPKISHYHGNPEVFAKTVMRTITNILDNQAKSNEKKLLLPDYVKGSSVRDI